MTPIATLPTTWGLLQAALQARRPVEVSYHGRCRHICPHALTNGTQTVIARHALLEGAGASRRATASG